MKRNLIVILPLVVMSLMLNATAHAQSLVQANVPFAFKVGSATLPAGTYVIKTLGNSTIAIQNRQTGAGAMSTTRREYPRNSGPKLVFRHMGNQYFLAEIWGVTGRYGMAIAPSKQEKDLEKELQLASGQSTAVGEEVLIALY
jgi:hypothetical protein